MPKYSRNISSLLCLPFTHLSFGCHVRCFEHPCVSMRAWVSHPFTDSECAEFEKHFTRLFTGVQLKVIASMKLPLILLSNLSTYLHLGAVIYFLLCCCVPNHSRIHPSMPPPTHVSIHPWICKHSEGLIWQDTLLTDEDKKINQLYTLLSLRELRSCGEGS